jgi:hypothetical protein
VWEPLREKFGRVIAADMAGFGFSDKPVSNITLAYITINDVLIKINNLTNIINYLDLIS